MAWWQFWKPAWERIDVPDGAESVDFSFLKVPREERRQYWADRDAQAAAASEHQARVAELRAQGLLGPNELLPEATAHSPTAQSAVSSEEEQLTMQVAQQAMAEVLAEEKLLGPYTDERRMQRMWEVAGLMVTSHFDGERRRLEQEAADFRQADLENQLSDLQESLDKLVELSANTPTNLAIQFQREHPFLAGVIGADIADRLRRR